MWFCGDAVDYLTRETDADFAGVLQRRVAEETIVKAAASSQTVALPVEGHARHDNQVDIGIVGEVLAGRLFDVDMDSIWGRDNNIRDSHGFDFTGYDIIFRGICPECKEKPKD